MLQNTVFLRTSHYVQATNVHTHDNHIPQCQHNPADVQYTHCQVQPFTLTKAITQHAHSPVCKHTHTHIHTYVGVLGKLEERDRVGSVAVNNNKRQ